MILDMRQAIGYLSVVMTCAAVWFAAGSAGSARAGCNPAPGEVCCETDITEECEKPAKVLLNGCSDMCEALPPGPGGEVALASSVDFTTEAGLKRMRYDRHGVADDCDPAVWEEVEEFSAAPEFTWTLSGPGCSESGVGSTASGTATQAGTYTVTFNATCDDECSEFPNGTSVSAVLTVLPPMTLSFSPAMLGLDRTDDGGEHKEGEASVEASVCPDAEPFYTWAPKAGVCEIPPGQPTEGASLTAVTYRTPDKEQCSSSYMDQTVSVDVSPRGSVSSNLFTVVKLDVTVGGVAEADEETAGAFVPYEADTNGTLSVRGIAALKPVAIECSPDDLPDSETVTVAAPAESLFEKIGDQYVPAQSEYKACEIGDKQFFLHGHAASGALRDLEIEATHANSGAKDKAKFTVVKVDTIDVTSTEAGASGNPPPFEGHKTDFGNPCDPADPGQALVVFHKDVRDANFVVQDYDVTLEANIVPTDIAADQLSESWSIATGPSSGSLNRTDTFEVKYQNAKKGGLYRFEFDLGLTGCAKSGANLLLPLGGPDVTAYYLSEAQRYDTWLTTMKARVNAQTTSDFAAGFIVVSYFTKTVNRMNHKYGTYEEGSSPCKAYCANTVTISGYVFGKDHIGNFLFSYLAARTGFTFGATHLGAKLVASIQGQIDFPDDQAAYTAGYAHGQNPNGNFKAILESKDIEAMQNETAKRAWPSTNTATGITYPTWGATYGGLNNQD